MIRVKGYWIVNGGKSEFFECDLLAESADKARKLLASNKDYDNYMAGNKGRALPLNIMLCTTTDLYGEGEVK